MTIDTDNFDEVKKRIRQIEPEVEVEASRKNKTVQVKNELWENRAGFIKAITALVLLVVGSVFQETLKNTPFGIAAYLVFGAAYLVVGWKVIASAARNILRGRVFNEQFLMTLATLGAIAIGEIHEAIAVMLFYVVGELFQDIAVGRSRRSIKSLLEVKPEYANLKAGNEIKQVSPEEVQVGDTIQVKPGEKVPLDGTVIKGMSFLDTAALTGESVPRKVDEGDEVLAGMINQSGLLTVQVKKLFHDSSISRMLEMVENATSRKAQTEKFITTFARYYTPVVVIIAGLIALLPPLLIAGATFSEWIYRALVVLVISCPCALVISIPLGYFGGVGLASKRGILVKGSNFLDALTRVGTVVFDKTGTLTKGEFKVSSITPFNGYSKQEVLEYAALSESGSNHPIARSILEAYGSVAGSSLISSYKEISGQGIQATIRGKEVLTGNNKLLSNNQTSYEDFTVDGTLVHVAIDKKYAGYIIISDTLKEHAKDTINRLKQKGIQTAMLTGDHQTAAQSVATKLGIDRYYAELLPEDKIHHVEGMLGGDKKIAFVGDGINDAPVIARADVGMAMGALGSDAAIETADVVLMTDNPSKVVDAIDVARKTRNVVWQNIFIALGIKLVFIALGIAGSATMWEAVFADMGVSLIAVFNAIRILKNNRRP
ncbi:MAG: cadmium-translocating P-type ATPase [Bacteroidales bacterium]|nr:cadmium-translocating P-type ATPase [Bacteroidales bacterium]